MKVLIDKNALKFVNSLQEDDRIAVKEHIVSLKNPREVRGIELLENGHCRLHVSRLYTIFFDILPDDTIGVFEVTTIEQAHKKYKRMK
jgi:mRNA-degrading endonuclease RelE of RelBE toxin-antitoxin system